MKKITRRQALGVGTTAVAALVVPKKVWAKPGLAELPIQVDAKEYLVGRIAINDSTPRNAHGFCEYQVYEDGVLTGELTFGWNPYCREEENEYVKQGKRLDTEVHFCPNTGDSIKYFKKNIKSHASLTKQEIIGYAIQALAKEKRDAIKKRIHEELKAKMKSLLKAKKPFAIHVV